jgi:hypothetical protein
MFASREINAMQSLVSYCEPALALCSPNVWFATLLYSEIAAQNVS